MSYLSNHWQRQQELQKAHSRQKFDPVASKHFKFVKKTFYNAFNHSKLLEQKSALETGKRVLQHASGITQ